MVCIFLLEKLSIIDKMHQVHNFGNLVDGLVCSLIFNYLLYFACSYCVISAVTTIFV